MSQSFDRRRRGPRRGYTLIELLVSMSTGALVLAGLASSLYISTKTLTPDVTATAESNRSSLALARIAADLRLALNFTERTATAITFTVPDRTGDGAVDTIRYSWSGTAGAPLLYKLNTSTAVAVATNIQQFNLSSLTRSIPAISTALSSTIFAYASPPEAKAAAAATSISIAKPTGLVPGNFMIAVVAVDGSVAASMTAPSGWTLVNRLADASGNVSAAVWWRFAEASEAANYSFSWADPKNAYGWIMRFSGVDSTAPINASSSSAGASAMSSPASPSVTTTIANAMILRIGGFDDGDVTVDSAGVSSHTTITCDESDNGSASASGAAAYVLQSAAGSTGTASFTLTNAQEYVTYTLALTPDDGL
jgi:Tfp pilus assembly protein PilW